jgi:glycosyltransferase involved in cell wall biosynthesis
MQRVLGGVDICVNPDRPSPLNDQSTMNKVLEYMALAKPMVQFESVEGRFSAGSAALYAAPGDVGDFADQVLRLLDDEALRLRMGAEGRRRLENELAWTHQKRALLDAYDCAFAPKGRTIAAADRPIVQA